MVTMAPFTHLVTLKGGSTLPRWALVLGFPLFGFGAVVLIAHAHVVSTVVGGVLLASGITALALFTKKAEQPPPQ
jgi:hypothetical protein